MKQRFAQSAAAEKSPRARTAAPDELRANEPSAGKTANAAETRVECAVDRRKRVDDQTRTSKRLEQSTQAHNRGDHSSAAHGVDQKKLGVPASRMLSRYVPRSVLREVYARDAGSARS